MVELVAKRYGTAIFQLAVENNQIEAVGKELAFIKEVLATEEEFVRILNHPKIVIDQKVQMVESIFKDKLSNDVLGLVVLTIVKGRQKHLPDIIAYSQQAIDNYNNILSASVTSADELTESYKKDIQDKLESLTKKTVNMTYNVDKSLIGGVVIRIGDRILDNSIRGKMTNMSKELLEA